MLNPWYPKAIVMVVIRAPYGKRSRTTPVAKSRKGTLEIILLTIAWIAFFMPLIWIVTPLFEFAEARSKLLIPGVW